MTEAEIYKLALETEVLDPVLSTPENWMTDAGSAKDDLLVFAERIRLAERERCATPPPGFALVPLEATEAMADAVYEANLDIVFGYRLDGRPDSAKDVYRVMVAAAGGSGGVK